MFTLAHLSDLHMASRPKGLQLVGKRGLGLINWKRKREHIHRPEVLDAITRDLAASHFDHIAVSGDLVNFSLPEEYQWARTWLDKVGSSRNVTVVPGNHDAYVRGVEELAAEFWGDYMTGDDGLQRFPFLRRRGAVALIALSTGLPTGPFKATGRLGERQLARLGEILDQTRDLFRIVLIHHPPRSAFKRHLRRLVDGAKLRNILAAKGAELLLHGHDHQRAVVWLDGPDRQIPAVGAPSASAISRHSDEDEAGYNIFHITGNGTNEPWHCEMTGRHRKTDGTFGDTDKRNLF